MDMSVIRNALMNGYATTTIHVNTIFFCIAITACLAVYINIVYRMLNKNSFYSRAFSTALIALAIITAAIILTIQSNIIVSLGMVGALSIVRFRTAIKDPMDLVFLFWAISVGIICGAGFSMIAFIASFVLTIVLIIVSILPSEKGSLVLVVNANEYVEEAILDICGQLCKTYKVRARNISKGNVNMAVEVRVNDAHLLVDKMLEVEHVTNVSLVEHDGDITA